MTNCVACGVPIDDTNKFEHDSSVCIKCARDFHAIFDEDGVDPEEETKIIDKE
jgi:hypothetical protein